MNNSLPTVIVKPTIQHMFMIALFHYLYIIWWHSDLQCITLSSSHQGSPALVPDVPSSPHRPLWCWRHPPGFSIPYLPHPSSMCFFDSQPECDHHLVPTDQPAQPKCRTLRGRPNWDILLLLCKTEMNKFVISLQGYNLRLLGLNYQACLQGLTIERV